jgi:hypothetical protein
LKSQEECIFKENLNQPKSEPESKNGSRAEHKPASSTAQPKPAQSTAPPPQPEPRQHRNDATNEFARNVLHGASWERGKEMFKAVFAPQPMPYWDPYWGFFSDGLCLSEVQNARVCFA